MDLAVYINELLRQQASLSIPGLGMFSQVRKDGCYHENEGIFSPPRYETHFEEQPSSDETLAKYISHKKNISVASASYFVEKYVNTLRQQSATSETQMNQIGWLHTVQNQLVFRPDAVTSTYEEDFFGLPPIAVGKIWEQLSGARHTPETVEVIPEAIIDPAAPAAETTLPPTPELAIFPEVLTLREEEIAPVKPAKIQQKPAIDAPEEVSGNYPEPKAAFNVWILVLVIVTVAAIILLALYQYKPGLFSKRNNSATVEHSNGAKAPVPAVNTGDTAKTSASSDSSPAPAQDTTAAAVTANANTHPAAAPDSALADIASQTDQVPAPADAAGKYQIMAGAFGNLKLAQQQVEQYRKQGIPASVFENRPGRSVKITQGTYATYQAAASKLQELQTQNKAIKGAYILRPKKTGK